MKASSTVGGQYTNSAAVGSSKIAGVIEEAGCETIKSADGGTRRCVVIRVAGFDKPIVLNSTNTQHLIKVFGDETDDWVGREVEVSTQMVKFSGKNVPGIVVTGKPA